MRSQGDPQFIFEGSRSGRLRGRPARRECIGAYQAGTEIILKLKTRLGLVSTRKPLQLFQCETQNCAAGQNNRLFVGKKARKSRPQFTRFLETHVSSGNHAWIEKDRLKLLAGRPAAALRLFGARYMSLMTFARSVRIGLAAHLHHRYSPGLEICAASRRDCSPAPFRSSKEL